LKFYQIQKIKFLGQRGDEAQSVKVILLGGEVRHGTIRISMNTIAGTAGSGGPVFTGTTELGKVSIHIKDVKEIYFLYPL
jgi:hypothetical protein